jgi:hypothetical protein
VHDHRVVEYAAITAALAILASSVGGVLNSVVPVTDLKAAQQVSSVARSHHVAGPRARAAYEHAPYRKPALRYLYAVGWVGAASNLGQCKAAQLLGPDPRDAAAQAIEASPKTLAALRAAHVTVAQAATAIGRGTTDGCA